MKYALSVIICAFVLIGCFKKESDPVRPGETYGYALLYAITSQEQNVDKLLWIKDPGPEITAWIKDISAFNTVVTTQLENWKKEGIITDLTNDGLPPAEKEARDRATSRTTGELLFSTDVDLRVALVVAQVKALGYCSDLSYAIHDMSKNADIQKAAESWQKQFAELNTTGMHMLTRGFESVDPSDSSQPSSKKATQSMSGPPSH